MRKSIRILARIASESGKTIWHGALIGCATAVAFFFTKKVVVVVIGAAVYAVDLYLIGKRIEQLKRDLTVVSVDFIKGVVKCKNLYPDDADEAITFLRNNLSRFQS